MPANVMSVRETLPEVTDRSRSSSTSSSRGSGVSHREEQRKHEGTRKKSKNVVTNAELVSRVVREKLELYINRECRENRWDPSGMGLFRTSPKMYKYDLAYRVLEATELEKQHKRKQKKKKKQGESTSDKEESSPQISPRLKDTSRKVVLGRDVERLTQYANQVFEEFPVQKLHAIHRYRPHTKIRNLTSYGKVQNYTRHVGAYLHTQQYIEYYTSEGLHTGDVSNAERFSRLYTTSQNSTPRESGTTLPRIGEKDRRPSYASSASSYSDHGKTFKPQQTSTPAKRKPSPRPESRVSHRSGSGSVHSYRYSSDESEEEEADKVEVTYENEVFSDDAAKDDGAGTYESDDFEEDEDDAELGHVTKDDASVRSHSSFSSCEDKDDRRAHTPMPARSISPASSHTSAKEHPGSSADDGKRAPETDQKPANKSCQKTGTSPSDDSKSQEKHSTKKDSPADDSCSPPLLAQEAKSPYKEHLIGRPITRKSSRSSNSSKTSETSRDSKKHNASTNGSLNPIERKSPPLSRRTNEDEKPMSESEKRRAPSLDDSMSEKSQEVTDRLSPDSGRKSSASVHSDSEKGDSMVHPPSCHYSDDGSSVSEVSSQAMSKPASIKHSSRPSSRGSYKTSKIDDVIPEEENTTKLPKLESDTQERPSSKASNKSDGSSKKDKESRKSSVASFTHDNNNTALDKNQPHENKSSRRNSSSSVSSSSSKGSRSTRIKRRSDDAAKDLLQNRGNRRDSASSAHSTESKQTSAPRDDKASSRASSAVSKKSKNPEDVNVPAAPRNISRKDSNASVSSKKSDGAEQKVDARLTHEKTTTPNSSRRGSASSKTGRSSQLETERHTEMSATSDKSSTRRDSAASLSSKKSDETDVAPEKKPSRKSSRRSSAASNSSKKSDTFDEKPEAGVKSENTTRPSKASAKTKDTQSNAAQPEKTISRSSSTASMGRKDDNAGAQVKTEKASDNTQPPTAEGSPPNTPSKQDKAQLLDVILKQDQGECDTKDGIAEQRESNDCENGTKTESSLVERNDDKSTDEKLTSDEKDNVSTSPEKAKSIGGQPEDCDSLSESTNGAKLEAVSVEQDDVKSSGKTFTSGEKDAVPNLEESIENKEGQRKENNSESEPATQEQRSERDIPDKDMTNDETSIPGTHNTENSSLPERSTEVENEVQQESLESNGNQNGAKTESSLVEQDGDKSTIEKLKTSETDITPVPEEETKSSEGQREENDSVSDPASQVGLQDDDRDIPNKEITKDDKGVIGLSNNDAVATTEETVLHEEKQQETVMAPQQGDGKDIAEREVKTDASNSTSVKTSLPESDAITKSEVETEVPDDQKAPAYPTAQEAEKGKPLTTGDESIGDSRNVSDMSSQETTPNKEERDQIEEAGGTDDKSGSLPPTHNEPGDKTESPSSTLTGDDEANSVSAGKTSVDTKSGDTRLMSEQQKDDSVQITLEKEEDSVTPTNNGENSNENKIDNAEKPEEDSLVQNEQNIQKVDISDKKGDTNKYDESAPAVESSPVTNRPLSVQSTEITETRDGNSAPVCDTTNTEGNSPTAEANMPTTAKGDITAVAANDDHTLGTKSKDIEDSNQKQSNGVIDNPNVKQGVPETSINDAISPSTKGVVDTDSQYMDDKDSSTRGNGASGKEISDSERMARMIEADQTWLPPIIEEADSEKDDSKDHVNLLPAPSAGGESVASRKDVTDGESAHTVNTAVDVETEKITETEEVTEGTIKTSQNESENPPTTVPSDSTPKSVINESDGTTVNENVDRVTTA